MRDKATSLPTLAQPMHDSANQRAKRQLSEFVLDEDARIGMPYADVCIPTTDGLYLRRAYVMHESRKRVAIVSAEDTLENPEFKIAMDKEIASFRAHDCIEEVKLTDLEEAANLVSTRWGFTIKSNLDCSKKHKVPRCCERN